MFVSLVGLIKDPDASSPAMMADFYKKTSLRFQSKVRTFFFLFYLIFILFVFHIPLQYCHVITANIFS